MKDILGERFADFKQAYDGKPRFKALRVNTLKISVEDFVALSGKYEKEGIREYALKKNPLCEQSFYTLVKPSLDPLYHAGLYYMQEPSASAAVAAFSPYIKGNVLDLCAAPGGKSAQAAAIMHGGVIFCNEPDGERRRVLSQNLSRLGVYNSVVTQATADDYADAGFNEYFDTLIVDAPCSGGGMSRYETVPYSREIVEGCAARQRGILDSACGLLKRGGYMLYSTCTFSEEEDEDNVRYIEDKGFSPVDIALRDGEERGINLPEARRVYPHRFDGEGHFYCVLQKTSGGENIKPPEKLGHKIVRFDGLELDCIIDPCGAVRYAAPFPRLDGLKKKYRGAGASVGGGEEPDYALIHALSKEQLLKTRTAELNPRDAERYIRGEQLSIGEAEKKGYCVATTEGFALGSCKIAPDGAGEFVLKNHYVYSERVKNK